MSDINTEQNSQNQLENHQPLTPTTPAGISRRGFFGILGGLVGAAAISQAVTAESKASSEVPAPPISAKRLNGDSLADTVQRQQEAIAKSGNAEALKYPVIVKPDSESLDERRKKETLSDEEMAVLGVKIMGASAETRIRRSFMDWLISNPDEARQHSEVAKVILFAMERSKWRPAQEHPDNHGFSKAQYGIIDPGFRINVIYINGPYLDRDKINQIPEEFRGDFMTCMDDADQKREISTGYTIWRKFRWPGNPDYTLINKDNPSRVMLPQDAEHYQFTVFVVDRGAYDNAHAPSMPGAADLNPNLTAVELRDPNFWRSEGKKYTEVIPGPAQLLHHELGHISQVLYNGHPEDETLVDTGANRDLIEANSRYKRGNDSWYPFWMRRHGGGDPVID